MFPSTSIVGNTDSYKYCHWMVYPRNVKAVSSYFESRTGAKFNKTVFAGLQYYNKNYLCGKVVTLDAIKQKKEFAKNHFGFSEYFNEDMWMHILRRYEGRLPIEIMAVPEGTPVDVSNVLMHIVNTDIDCAPLTNHLETILSNIWAPCTVATLSREVKIMCMYYAKETADDVGFVNFQLHDFGQRGVSSPESAGVEGFGHIINFMGTDTTLAMDCAHDFYNASYENMAFSVLATEHSNMTSLGPDGEIDIFDRVLTKAPGAAIISLVIDSYDYRRFISDYAFRLKSKIISREGRTVFRPDSGDPTSVTLDCLRRLGEVFGFTKNNKGYAVLHPKIRVLWGDGIDYDGIRSILYSMRNNGWSSENIVFGMGGGLLQKINRDTQRFAFKCSAQLQGEEWVDIYKDPLESSKKSKRGRLKLLVDSHGKYYTEQIKSNEFDPNNKLISVFKNGELLVDQSLNDIRARAVIQ